MDKQRVIYLGNIPEVSNLLWCSNEFELIAVLYEKNRFSDEMLLFKYSTGIYAKEVSNTDEILTVIQKMSSIDAIIMCGFGIILKEKLLNKYKVYNFHTGELPFYKGRHPIFHAIVNGEKHIGVTLHLVNEKIDDGGIIAIDKIKLGYRDTQKDILNQLPNSINRMIPVLYKSIKGKIEPNENNHGKYYPPVSRNDIVFDNKTNIRKVINLIRAQSIYNGAIFKDKNKEIRVIGCSIKNIKKNNSIKNGVVYESGKILGLKIDNQKLLFFNILNYQDEK
jgi:methionyl-tRNA formyltransferase